MTTVFMFVCLLNRNSNDESHAIIIAKSDGERMTREGEGRERKKRRETENI